MATIVSAHLTMNDYSSLGNLSGDGEWAGPIELNGSSSWPSLYTPSGSLGISGSANGISLNGLRLSGTNTLSLDDYAAIYQTVYIEGTLPIPLQNYGTLEVTGTTGDIDYGTIRGNGTVGSLTYTSTLSPGTSAAPAGILSTGNLSHTFCTVLVDINGDDPGNGTNYHDQVRVTGTVNVGGTLQVAIDPTYTPLYDHEYVIIDNDDTDPISGTFSGLDEGSLLVVDTHVFRISYAGGDGNDVVLISENGNQLPIADAGASYSNSEGLAITFDAYGSSDPDPLDMLTYRWDFEDDGVWDTAWSSDPTISHTWGDDHSGTVRVEVYDGSHSDTDTATVTIQNVAPTIDTLVATPLIDEQGTVHLVGTYSDVGTVDTHELTIDWGEGAAQVVTVTGGKFDIAHQYLENDPSGTGSDDYNIAVTLEDDDTGSSTQTVQVSVVNVVPTLAGLTATSIDEAGTSTLNGTIIDPGMLDTFTLTVDWGDGSPLEAFSYAAGTTSFSETHEYLDDDPSGTSADDYVITLTVEDDDGGTGTGNTQVTVSNVAPMLSDLTAAADNGSTTTLSGTIFDPGILDTLTLTVDWGDGSGPETFNYLAGTTSFLETHAYAEGGIYEIAVTLSDDDTGTDEATAMSYVPGVGVQNGALNIVGTSANDRVTLRMTSRGMRVVTNVAGRAYYDPATFDRAVIYLGEGDDRLSGGNATIPIVAHGGGGVDRLTGGNGDDCLLGEAGNDVLSGRNGNDVLIGGVGNDRLSGQRDHDLLIGGAGADRLSGSSGDDLLIGGHTSYDSDLDAQQVLMAEWSSGHLFEERIGNLDGTGPGPHPNTPYYLIPVGAGQTCFGDSGVDRLVGGSGNDWLIGDAFDVLRSGEELTWM